MIKLVSFHNISGAIHKS